jgi:hypothetical protein
MLGGCERGSELACVGELSLLGLDAPDLSVQTGNPYSKRAGTRIVEVREERGEVAREAPCSDLRSWPTLAERYAGRVLRRRSSTHCGEGREAIGEPNAGNLLAAERSCDTLAALLDANGAPGSSSPTYTVASERAAYTVATGRMAMEVEMREHT